MQSLRHARDQQYRQYDTSDFHTQLRLPVILFKSPAGMAAEGRSAGRGDQGGVFFTGFLPKAPG